MKQKFIRTGINVINKNCLPPSLLLFYHFDTSLVWNNVKDWLDWLLHISTFAGQTATHFNPRKPVMIVTHTCSQSRI